MVFLVLLNALIWPAFFLKNTALKPAALLEQYDHPGASVLWPASVTFEKPSNHDVPISATLPAPSPAPTPVLAITDTTAPTRLRIPAIGVNAPIGAVGLAPDGSMGVPKRPAHTTWYALGPRPGEAGSAVIAGHVSWMYGATAVFAELHTLAPGNTITVQAGDGKIISFVVREIRAYDAAADATDIFFSADGQAHLNLVTCSGTWDKNAKQYTERLVVFADKVTAVPAAQPADAEILSPSP